MEQGTVEQISVSGGGVPKLPIEVAEVGHEGVLGDDHHDKVNHGGPDRALCLFSLELIGIVRSEGHPIVPGSAGENLTVSGLDWSTVVPGKRYRAGEVELQITSYTTPCKNIAGSFMDGEFNRISPRLRIKESRVYARVLKPGVIRRGDPIAEIAD
ncbi:MAG TPA: MOSC domain-containing protein [Dehalococcoidia bacterium]|nr:MOSC domain-containing protein [Dehalococcoidia bacterium]